MYCSLSYFSQQPTPMPCFAPTPPLSLLLRQPRAELSPACCKNSSWRRMAILSATIALICHAFALEARIFPGGESGQNLSLLNVRVAGQPDDLVRWWLSWSSRNRGWLLLPIVAMPSRWSARPSPAFCVPNEIYHPPKPPRGCWCISACRSSRTPRWSLPRCMRCSWRWIDYQLRESKLALSERNAAADEHWAPKCSTSPAGRVLLTLTLCSGLFLHAHLFVSAAKYR